MIAGVAGGVAAVGAAVGLYRRGTAEQTTEQPSEQEEEKIIVVDEEDDAKTLTRRTTWKASSGRADGPDNYVFGDVTRGVVVKVKNYLYPCDDAAIEAAGDAQHTQVQRLVREAVRLFRLRGYTGTVHMSHTVAYFTESVNVRVDGPAEGETPEWQSAAAEAEAARLIAEDGRAGLVFATLLARLERRAKSWAALSGEDKLDPNLTSSAQIGFALPVVKLGWGVSVSLTVSASSLLRWAEHAAVEE